jgi:hypothetical protein
VRDIIEFPSWTGDLVELQLAPLADGELRGLPARAPADLEPVVRLPRTAVDCLTFDTLEHHPAVDSLLRELLARGAAFRLLRLPFSLRPPRRAVVEEIRFTAEVTGAARVHNIYPLRDEVYQQVTRELAVEPGLTIGPVELGAGRIGRKIVFRQARAATLGYWSENGADWVLRRPDPRDSGLEGTWEFALILQWPAEVTPIDLTLSVSATVSTRRLRWLTRRAEHSYGPVHLAGCRSIV